MFRIGQVCETFGHTHHEQDRRANPHGHAGVSLLDFEKSRSANRRALRNDRRGNATPPSGNPDVSAQLAQGASDWDWQCDGGSTRSHL
jgi:hypothetical protein